MSTPKLKVYRLAENYSQSTDNDIQTMTNDEYLPVVEKFIEPFRAEPMVGVRERRDAHLVKENDGWNLLKAYLVDPGTDGYFTTEQYVCDGWVLGKANIELYVCVCDENTGTEFIPFDGDDIENPNRSWKKVPRFYWDYSIEEQKHYCKLVSSGEFASSDGWFNGNTPVKKNVPFSENGWFQSATADAGATEIHNASLIRFSIGKMLIKSSEENNDGGIWGSEKYSGKMPLWEIDSTDGTQKGVGYVYVRYKTYDEFYNGLTSNFDFDSASFTSTNGSSINTRISFSDVYNGNLEGRMISYKKKDVTEDKKVLVGTDVPNVDEYLELKDFPHYYEGNYLFKRKILPLRCKVGSVNDEGSCLLNAENKWCVDGLLKPVAMELITVSDASGAQRKIFKKLTDSQANLKIVSSIGAGGTSSVSCRVSFLETYYKVVSDNNVYRQYPEKVFVFYNFQDDVLDDIFDFDYDYSNAFKNENDIPKYFYDSTGDSTPKFDKAVLESVLYGKNTGLVVASENPASDGILIRREKLLVESSQALKDNSQDWTFEKDSPSPSVTREFGSAALLEKGVRIYNDGVLWWDSTWDASSLPEGWGWTIELGNNTITLTKPAEETWPDDLMVVYYEKIPFKYDYDVEVDSESLGSQIGDWVIGYRLPCYEKVQTASLFVSSYPSWVKGHLNNDLDIFVGMKAYSGVDATVENGQNGIYPQYQRDGWFAMYPDGAVQFAEPQKTQDYFDLLNYSPNVDALLENSTGSQSSSNLWNISIAKFGPGGDLSANSVVPDAQNITNTQTGSGSLLLYYSKVRYNVAHYDGINTVFRTRLSNYSVRGGWSRYALLEGDEGKNSIGKRWIIRNDNQIPRLFESGTEQLPEIHSANGETMTTLRETELDDGKVIKLSTCDNRIRVIRLKYGVHGGMVLLDSNYTSENDGEVINVGESDGINLINLAEKRLLLKLERPEEGWLPYLKLAIDTRSNSLSSNDIFDFTSIGGWEQDPESFESGESETKTSKDLEDLSEIDGKQYPNLSFDNASDVIGYFSNIRTAFKTKIEFGLCDLHFKVFSYRQNSSDSNERDVELVIYREMKQLN